MSERTGKSPMHDLTLEEALETYFAAEPAPEFLATLEQKLLAEQAKRERKTAGSSSPAAVPSPSFWQQLAGLLRPRPAAVALVLLLVLLVPLLIIGPRKAWAGLQAWLGYVPGVGFVDLEQSRLLANPASVTREGVTLHVEQVVAGIEDTVVVIGSEGLPPQEQLWPDGQEDFDEFQARLRLPDGEVLAPTSRTMRVGSASLVFPALPPYVYRITLELPRLPLVPAGAAPENWAVPLLLQPASGEVVAEMYPQPYRPQGAVESHQRVTLRVLEVAHHPEETAVQMQLDWENPEWENHFGPKGLQLPYLRDAEGNRYNVIPGSTTGSQVVREVQPAAPGAPTPPPNRWVGSETFEPVPPATEALTLVVDGVDFDIPASGSFTVDLGDSPQIGDTWDLDVTLHVAGFPVHITGAELTEEEMRLREGVVRQTVLRFDVEPIPQQENRRLFGLFLEAPDSAFHSGGTGYTIATNKIRTGLELDEGTPVPTGQIDVRLRGASLLIRGPWEIAWPVPHTDNDVEESSPLTEPNGSPVISGQRVGSTDELMQQIEEAGAIVELGRETIERSLSDVEAQSLTVNGQPVHLFEFETEEAAEEAMEMEIEAFIEEVGFDDAVRFFEEGRFLLLFVGENEEVIRALTQATGLPFFQRVPIRPSPTGTPAP